jgi:5-formyltetrahydrofolate cyclo-ligase
LKANLPDQKKAARAQAAIRRQAAHGAAGATAGAALAALGLPPGVTGRIVSGFLPFRSEIDTRPLLARLAGEGFATCLPVVVAKSAPLLFRAWRAGDALAEGLWGIPVPLDSAEELLPDILFVPMLAFDAGGYRLGYGGGFYDRTLAKLRALKPVTAIGVAYAAQEMIDLPRNGHDEPLDWIMTEKGFTECG